ncbi:hypothetical protein Bca52824_010904 [Brassica carinata]|uniref:Uncharacterized protein n=1 Tax=Brassica carinata TaxID=52824 RepID=A0A8X7WE99_BRACI|nr:hypothetical protein Bca52824_010904 [Brassica carinata]
MAKGLAPDTELLSSEGVSGKLQTQRDKQGDREYDTIGGAKGKRGERRRGEPPASGLTRAPDGRPEPPSTGAKQDLKLFESRDGRERRERRERKLIF